MSTVTGSVPRQGLALQRFLALFLFAGAFIFGVGAVAAVGEVFLGDMRALGMLAGAELYAWMLGWLGIVVWSGRAIPRWFIASFLLLTCFGSLTIAFHCNTWAESFAVVGMVAPYAISVQSIVQNYPGKPPKPKTFDDELA